MLTVVAVAIISGCVVASVRRLYFAVAPTPIDPKTLLDALPPRGESPEKSADALARLNAALANEDDATWERELVGALAGEGAPDAPPHVVAGARAAAVNELLGELDQRVDRWARVPRVCTRVAATTGFLLASLALRNGLAAVPPLPSADDPDADPNAGPEMRRAVDAAVIDAIDVVAIGLAGAIVCTMAGRQANAAARARLAATDKLVERLEALAGKSDPAA